MSPLDWLDGGKALDFEALAEKPRDLAPRHIYKPAGPVTAAFHDSRAYLRLLRGPVGCGKTFAAFREIFTRAFNMPVGKNGVAHTRAVVCRRTYKQLRESTVNSFWGALPARWDAAGNFNKSEMKFVVETTIQRGGENVKMLLEVLFVAMDSDRALEQFKGMEFNLLYLNEADHINAMALQMGMSRMGRFPPADTMANPDDRQFYIILDSNSFDPAHPFYAFFYNDKIIAENAAIAGLPPRDYLQVFDYPSGLSPDAENLKNLERDYYAKRSAGQSPQYVDVMIKNRFGAVAEGRPCYGAFRADIHASEYIAPDKDLPIFCGVDFGRDPAIVVCQEDEDGNVVVIDAEYRLKTEGATGLREMVSIFAARYPRSDGWKWVRGGHDPGGAAMTQVFDISPVQMLLHLAQQFGVCETGKAWSNSPNDRIDVVNRMLSEMGTKRIPQLRISYDPRNRGLLWLIRAMAKYQYAKIKGNTTAEDRYREQPDKSDVSHIAESLQYALLRPDGGAREKLKYHPGKKEAVKVPALNMSPFKRR